MNIKPIDYPAADRMEVRDQDATAKQPDDTIEKLRQEAAFRAWLNNENIGNGIYFLDAVEISVPHQFAHLGCGCTREPSAQSPWAIKRDSARPNIYHTACERIIGEIGLCPIDI